MAEYDRSHLPEEKRLLIMTSTYGDGDPPDNAMDFHGWLSSEDAPKLDSLQYSVLALGDTNYPDFCKCGIEFDERLSSLGASRIAERFDCDVDFDEPFQQWLDSIKQTFATSEQETKGGPVKTESSEKNVYNKKNPFSAKVLKNVNLNGPDSAKETRHVEISLNDSGLEYSPGDALAVVPENDPGRVNELIAALGFEPGAEVLVDGDESIPLQDALLTAHDISKLSLKGLSNRSDDECLSDLVSDRAAFIEYASGRELIDLLEDFNPSFDSPSDFLSILPKLAPRLYSISSSPRAHRNEVHITVGVVRYETCDRARKGVCSSYLAERPENESLRIFFHSTNSFRLPENGDAPIIMVGPGTGIAPFRAFIEERKARGERGENWLFFGDQTAQSDFLYQDELEDYFREGALNRLDTAFSRDQSEKIYVQDRMLENGAELFEWLERGAYFYVCGDASRMAKDVDAALHEIVEAHGKMDTDSACAYVKSLKSSKRYLRDVY